MRDDLKRLDEQATSYRDASPATLLEQLNTCWTKVRSFQRAVADRDRVIDELNDKLLGRDEVIEKLKRRLRFARARVAFLYSIIGGAVATAFERIITHWLTK